MSYHSDKALTHWVRAVNEQIWLHWLQDWGLAAVLTYSTLIDIMAAKSMVRRSIDCSNDIVDTLEVWSRDVVSVNLVMTTQT